MSKTMYVTNIWSNIIERVSVERETPKQVVLLSGRQEFKDTRYLKYHETWEAARSHLISQAEKRLSIAKGRLPSTEEELREALAIPVNEPTAK